MAYDEEKIYTIEGKTLDGIKDKLYSKYGTDFHIVNKRTEFRPAGFLGLSQKEVQIVKYKIDHKTYESDGISNVQPVSPIPGSSYNELRTQADEAIMEKNRRELLEMLSKQQTSSVSPDVLAKLTKQVEELTNQISSMSNTISTNTGLSSNDSSFHNHPTVLKIEELLSQNEFTLPYIRMIEDKIAAKFHLNEIDDFKSVERFVVQCIGESIQIATEKVYRPPHVIIIVGPTGVGKTTTIAKMAANAYLDTNGNEEIKRKPEFCIVTIDTMRVGAMEQLSKFGEILGKNVLKAEHVEDVKKIYNDYKDHVDYIFIDTSGYSPNDSIHISEMKTMLEVNMNPDVYLSVSASTKASDIANIFRNYEPFAYESVIITKCDETKCFGNIISALWEKHKSVSYITDGQRVPRNIRKASVIDFLIRLTGFDVDRINIENMFGEKE